MTTSNGKFALYMIGSMVLIFLGAAGILLVSQRLGSWGFAKGFGFAAVMGTVAGIAIGRMGKRARDSRR